MKSEKKTGNNIKNVKPESEKRHMDNLERNSTSIESTHFFSKHHNRNNHSFGGGHEPGTLPGAGV
ncbi:hypothetical protein [Pedobacter sp. MW01-1-1]|uniref:hypothetical protein n=1 Tax=Pedobacter sp. MW01-1-1 TaxID=3383027 RepID=UPI003FEF02A4